MRGKPTIANCPVCAQGVAVLTEEDDTITYREQSYVVRREFYHCGSCLQEFTTAETDDATLARLGQLYRQRNPDGPESPYEKLNLNGN